MGPGPGPQQVISGGMAAHIYAASPSGPRGTGGLSAAERREPENGIWTCYFHGKAIDSDSGGAFSADQLKAWKRLHEARKNAEMTGAAQDRFGLVESISVNSAPALTGRKFDLGMRNIITGPNASGKTVLARLIASVAYPDHVARLSQRRNVDIEVRWFDPYIHNVATAGRAGNVTHVLDGRPVPYVARPYKTMLLNYEYEDIDLGNLVTLSQIFDLSLSAMKGMLSILVGSSDLVKEISIHGTRIDWVLEIAGRTVRSTNGQEISRGVRSLILLELAGFHAQFHARVEPTFLLIDEMLDFFHPRESIAALRRLQVTAEHAQVAVISHSTAIVGELAGEWTFTTLSEHRPNDIHVHDCPIDFEIETTTPPPRPPASGSH